jgi:hypothetical protein
MALENLGLHLADEEPTKTNEFKQLETEETQWEHTLITLEEDGFCLAGRKTNQGISVQLEYIPVDGP